VALGPERLPPEAPAVLGDALWAETFAELKKIAHARLYSAGGLTQLSTTALVNESWLKLAERRDALQFPSRGHFFAYAARTMRSIIVDLLRERAAERRGGRLQRVTLDTALAHALPAHEDPVQVDDALRKLEALEPRLGQVVEMRFFAGMTELEVAEVLGLTERTVRRDWDKARALLRAMLG
jgi:RNA polymerase sigma factor (TIGR02999 family)